MQRIHENALTNQIGAICEYCALPFSSNTQLNQHVRSAHTSEAEKKEVQCDICQKWYRDKRSIKRHMEVHTDASVKCPSCDKISPNRKALGKHIRRVHEYKAIYSCHLCNKSFKLTEELKVWTSGLNGLYNHEEIDKEFVVFHLYRSTWPRIPAKRYSNAQCARRHSIDANTCTNTGGRLIWLTRLLVMKIKHKR